MIPRGWLAKNFCLYSSFGIFRRMGRVVYVFWGTWKIIDKERERERNREAEWPGQFFKA